MLSSALCSHNLRLSTRTHLSLPRTNGDFAMPCLPLVLRTAAAIVRSSQPMVGITQRRCAPDEQYMQRANIRWVFDARPRKNALGNMAMGKGYEREGRYSNLKLVFLDIENIHVVRESLIKFMTALTGMKLSGILAAASSSTSTVTGVVGGGQSGGAGSIPGGEPSPGHVLSSSKQDSSIARSNSGSGKSTATSLPSPASSMSADVLQTFIPHSAKSDPLAVAGSAAPGESNWMSAVESSKWLKHVQTLLVGAVRIMQVVAINAQSCLVHCSDGWDRTAQLCALAQSLLDPYFRTIRGFAVLIEKDFCAFGHMFHRRCGHDGMDNSDEQRSPIFLQYLDACWQLIRQFPRAFEFNEVFLDEVATASYSCRFGTFLYNCDKARRDGAVQHRTASLWSHLSAMGDRVKNPDYRRTPGLITPKCGLRNLSIWPYHKRHIPSIHPVDVVDDVPFNLTTEDLLAPVRRKHRQPTSSR